MFKKIISRQPLTTVVQYLEYSFYVCWSMICHNAGRIWPVVVTKMYENGSCLILASMYDYELKSPSNVPIFSRSAKKFV